jgi:hypothetical protein
MDPFLESPAYWRDFHQSFITYWRDWLLDHLPDHYEVRIDERLSVVNEGLECEDVLPDLSVSQSHPLPRQLVPTTATAVLDIEPATLRLKYLEVESEAYLKVLHRPDASLIAVLELLSPTNKSGEGRRDYLLKRHELLQEPIHLVELDFLLGGTRIPTHEKLPAGDYYAFVSRGDRRPECEVYSWNLPEPLRRIRLPLKAPDPDVVFDLPDLFAHAYQRGRYFRDLPYTTEPPVPLSKENAQWVKERLAEWQKRST